MEYKGFTARVEYDHDAGVLHGEVEGLRDVITFEATDVRSVEDAFRESIDDYLEQCRADGVEPERPYSGKFLVRVDPKLHREIAYAAARAGKSLNSFSVDALRRIVAEELTVLPTAGDRASRSRPLVDEVAGVPIYGAVPAPSESRPVASERAPAWRTFTRDTPGSITPNTPEAPRTPSANSFGVAA